MPCTMDPPSLSIASDSISMLATSLSIYQNWWHMFHLISSSKIYRGENGVWFSWLTALSALCCSTSSKNLKKAIWVLKPSSKSSLSSFSEPQWHSISVFFKYTSANSILQEPEEWDQAWSQPSELLPQPQAPSILATSKEAESTLWQSLFFSEL